MRGQYAFKAILERPDGAMDAAFIVFPFDVEKEFGTRGQIKVNATFDRHPYRGVLASMGTDHHAILVRKDIRQTIGKKVGDSVAVTITKDEKKRRIDLPDELARLLDKNRKAKSFFETLSYSNQKEYVVWIKTAKKKETKSKRLQEALRKLLNRKRNPGEK
jgi:Domain of unknown function (DUF1905)/Bacteriocin-protection, YdeI or OmpD-Associated